MMTFFSDLHDRWARDRASCLVCALHSMLIGVVALSFDAGRVPPPLRVMEGRSEEQRVCRKSSEKPQSGNMCSVQGSLSKKKTKKNKHDQVCERLHMVHRSELHGMTTAQGDRGEVAANRKHVPWRSMQAYGRRCGQGNAACFIRC